MDSRSFRARSLVTSCILTVPALSLFYACGTPASKIGTSELPDGGGFGDVIVPIKHDATMPPKDTGPVITHDAPKESAVHETGPTDAPPEGSLGESDAGPNTPCTANAECQSKICVSIVDAAPPTTDGAILGCAAPGAHCTCTAPTCSDGVLNGTETAIDCGGGTCPKCKDGSTCILGHQDCVSGECGLGTQGGACSPGDAGASGCTCEPPNCTDGVLNGTETDKDCGSSGSCPTGETCPKCTPCTTGKVCSVPADCVSATCDGNVCACPPGMTEASTSLNIPYCIDAYEATYNQYTAFKNSNEPTSQPTFCSWNSSFAPTANFPQLAQWSNNPVTDVNWCDAYMFCHASGKHLCGQIANVKSGANEGDPIDPGSANDATKDEWFNACSDQSANLYPYASTTYNPFLCNGADSFAQTGVPVDGGAPPLPEWDTWCNSVDSESDSPVPTAAAGETFQGGGTGMCMSPPNFFEANCIGGTSNELYDMSGNVAEWENSCTSIGDAGVDAGAGIFCNVRGGSFKSPRAGMTCATSGAQPQMQRDMTAHDVGIRCCL